MSSPGFLRIWDTEWYRHLVQQRLEPQIRCVHFSEDGTLILVGTSTGFIIFDISSENKKVRQVAKRDLPFCQLGGVSFICGYARSQLLAMVPFAGRVPLCGPVSSSAGQSTSTSTSTSSTSLNSSSSSTSSSTSVDATTSTSTSTSTSNSNSDEVQQNYFPLMVLYDAKQNAPLVDITFQSQVRAVLLRRHVIVVVLDRLIVLYSPSSMSIIARYPTYHNPHGLCQVHVSERGGNSIVVMLAFPFKEKGHVFIDHLALNSSVQASETIEQNFQRDFSKVESILDNGSREIPRSFGRQDMPCFKAHEGELQCISFSQDGSRLATCSDRGTLIRIWDTDNLVRLKELRRGTVPATIYSIAFSHDAAFLACTSNSGTMHIFSLTDISPPHPPDSQQQNQQQQQQQQQPAQTVASATSSSRQDNTLPSQVLLPVAGAENRRSAFYWIGLGNYVSWANSEWSIAEWQSKDCECPCICSFSHDGDYSLRVITAEGLFLRLEFDPRKPSSEIISCTRRVRLLSPIRPVR